MDETELVIETPVESNGMKIITVVERRVYLQGAAGARLYFANKSPLYILVVSASLKKAYRADGEEISLKQLTDIMPGIRTVAV